MNQLNHQRARRRLAWPIAATIALLPLSANGQTQISYHSNKYKPSDDVKLGRQAAAQVEQQFPILRDPEVNSHGH